MLDISTVGPATQVFTFIDPHTDGVLHFHASMMREYAETLRDGKFPDDIDVMKVAIDAEVLALTRYHRGVAMGHVAQYQDIDKPVIGVHCDDDTTLSVDGHHCIMARAARGLDFYYMLRFKRGTWQRFLLDLPREISAYLEADVRREMRENAGKSGLDPKGRVPARGTIST